MLRIKTETIIEAPLDRVCELLNDTTLYPQWNPFFSQVAGRLEVGAALDVTVALPGIKPFTVRTAVREYSAAGRLRWRYSYPLPGLFSWTYGYEVRELERGRLMFVQESVYAGILAPLYHLGLKKALQTGMAEFSKAMQRWGERRGISCLKC